MFTDVSVCSGQFLLGCVLTQEQAHPTAVIDVLCRTWFKSELKHQLLVNACLYFDTTAGIVITVREGCRRWVCDCCENQQHQHI